MPKVEIGGKHEAGKKVREIILKNGTKVPVFPGTFLLRVLEQKPHFIAKEVKDGQGETDCSQRS